MSKLKFWGVQGSCPGGYVKDSYGCNSPCVSIEENKNLIILDAGTGIRNLSTKLKSQNYKNILLLITHSHWDHIQGFPFFNFLHEDCTIHIYSHNKNHLESLTGQLNGVNFPLKVDDIVANLKFHSNFKELESLFNISIDIINTNHHGDCIGFRIKSETSDICYLPDNQLHNHTKTTLEEFINFCKNTNYLIHDAQYTEKDMPKKENWGHSILKDALKLANSANAKTLILFHHDPDRKKSEIESKIIDLKQASTPQIIASFEGLELDLLGN